MDIQGRTFLVTGGASGLGAACAIRIVEGGGRAMIADLDADAGLSLARSLGASCAFMRADVCCSQDMGEAIDGAVTLSRGDGLRGAVHCAGIAPAQRLIGKDGSPHMLELFQKVVEVNLTGTFNVARLAAAAMAGNAPLDDGERGVIVMTSSIAAFEGQVGQAAYAASKGGVASMTLPLARELARHGVRVVTIAPGIFDTPMMGAMPEKVRGALAASVPFPSRLGRADEFAALASHIIENRMLNGCTIRLDGAVRMAGK